MRFVKLFVKYSKYLEIKTMNDIYQEVILDEYKHPRNKGKLASADICMPKANASCGDDVTVYIKLSDDKTRVSDISWEGSGCVISQVSISMLSEHVKGKTTSEIMHLTKDTLIQLLGLTDISYGREKCLVLGLQAVQKAVAEEK